MYIAYGYLATGVFDGHGVVPGLAPITATLALILAGWLMKNNYSGWAFTMTGITIVFATITIFSTLFPRVIVSSLNDAWSLTIYTASSSQYTLQVMSIVALIFVPVVLLYQGWTYWVFRKRVSVNSELEY